MPALPVRRRHWPATLTAIALALAPLPSAAARPVGPNVIVLVTDDQGYGDLSCHGNPILRTPHLDRLHGESVRLVDFHVVPICTPTRGQLLTGVHCLRNGAMNVSSGRARLRPDFPTAGERFAAAGYRTGLFGKWHLGDNLPCRPQDRGFEESVWFPSSHIGSAPDHWGNDYFDDVYRHNGRSRRYEGYTTDVFFTEAIGWMHGCVGRGERFFCYLPTAAAHTPHYVSDSYRRRFEAAGMDDDLARFFGMLTNVDDNVGKLDDFLREAGIFEDTILVFLTDNGGTSGVRICDAGMRGAKFSLYDGGHRVPCFIRWPRGRLRAPRDVDGLTAVQDLAPTLLELCGIASPATDFDGVSLAKPLRGEGGPPADRHLVVQYSRIDDPRPRRGDACVLWQRWRLVGDEELYDVAADPGQKNNVFAAYPGVVADMRRRYAAWWATVEPRLHDLTPIVIGDSRESPTQLSPADWADVFLDQGVQIRDGIRRNGVWHLEVTRAGPYRIEVRRWPREVDVPLNATLPAALLGDGAPPQGTALPVKAVRIRIGEVEHTQEAAGLQAAHFTVNLTAGRTQLRASLLDAAGKEIAGGYFTYVSAE